MGVIAAWRRGTFADWGGPERARLLFPADAVAGPDAPDPLLRGAAELRHLRPLHRVHRPVDLEAILDRLEHMILPSLTLGLVLYGEYALIVRSSMLETLGEDYILTARAKGLANWSIVWHHAFRNALLPIVTLIALTLGYVVAGAILVEAVFSYPGIGSSPTRPSSAATTRCSRAPSSSSRSRSSSPTTSPTSSTSASTRGSADERRSPTAPPAGETMFPPRAPFFESAREPPGSLRHPPLPHEPEAGS